MQEPGAPATDDEITTDAERDASAGAAAREYLYDMLGQMAILARKWGEESIAVSLAMAVLEGKRSSPGGALQ